MAVILGFRELIDKLFEGKNARDFKRLVYGTINYNTSSEGKYKYGSLSETLITTVGEVILDVENKKNDYIIVESGTSYLIFAIISKFIIDYCNVEGVKNKYIFEHIYDSKTLESSTLKIKPTDKVLVVDIMPLDTSGLCKTVQKLQDYNVTANNVSFSILHPVNGISVSEKYQGELFDILKRYLNSYKEEYRVSQSSVELFCGACVASMKAIIRNTPRGPYYIGARKLAYESEEVWYKNKSFVIDEIDFTRDDITKSTFEFYPTIDLKKFKSWLIQDELITHDPTDDELKLIYDFIMLRGFKESLFYGCQYIYNIEGFNYKKFAELNLSASFFDKFVDQELDYYTNNSGYLSAWRYIVETAKQQHPAEVLSYLKSGLVYYLEHVIENKEKGLNCFCDAPTRLFINDIVRMLKKNEISERDYFLFMSYVTQMYHDGILELKSDIFTDEKGKKCIGPMISSERKMFWFSEVYNIGDNDFVDIKKVLRL